MPQQIIDLGSAPDVGGDTIRAGGQKINDNFTEVYGLISGLGTPVESVVAGTGVSVDSTDPANPVVALNSASQASLSLADSALQPSDVPGEFTFVDDATGAMTLALSDQSTTSDPKILRLQHATANTVTVPPNSSVAFPVGSVVNILHDGAGSLTIAQGSGVTVRTPSGGTLVSAGTGTLLVLLKINTDTWQLVGATTAA